MLALKWLTSVGLRYLGLAWVSLCTCKGVGCVGLLMAHCPEVAVEGAAAALTDCCAVAMALQVVVASLRTVSCARWPMSWASLTSSTGGRGQGCGQVALVMRATVSCEPWSKDLAAEGSHQLP
jgi:hypothetical protein